MALTAVVVVFGVRILQVDTKPKSSENCQCSVSGSHLQHGHIETATLFGGYR
jgi:hypothetical protein